jgi:hypothetical protein
MHKSVKGGVCVGSVYVVLLVRRTPCVKSLRCALPSPLAQAVGDTLQLNENTARKWVDYYLNLFLRARDTQNICTL